jgi:hypothetical protein
LGCEWLEHLYRLEADGQHDAAVDMVFDNVDDLLRAGSFSACDDLLTVVDVDQLSTWSIVAFLVVTNAAKWLLQTRSAFCERARHRVEALAPARAHRLLSGLMGPL